jgi:hypothetical protein
VAAYVIFMSALGGIGEELLKSAVALHLVSLDQQRLVDVYGLVFLALVVFIALSHRKFWGISWLAIYWVALIIFLVSTVTLALVIGPIALAIRDGLLKF